MERLLQNVSVHLSMTFKDPEYTGNIVFWMIFLQISLNIEES